MVIEEIVVAPAGGVRDLWSAEGGPTADAAGLARDPACRLDGDLRMTETRTSPPAVSLPTTDPTQLRQAFALVPSGVAAVCARVGPAATGMLVSSYTSVSLDPAMLSVCIKSSSRTWESLRTSDEVGISFLNDAQDRLCARFSRAGPDRLAGFDVVVTDRGAVLIPDAVAWFTCSIHDEIPAGDHVIVLLRIAGYETRPVLNPLIFHRSAFTRLPR